MWPVKNNHGPARTPCAYWISVPPIGVGAMNFTSTIPVSILHVATVARLPARAAAPTKVAFAAEVRSLTPGRGNPYGFSPLRWRPSLLRVSNLRKTYDGA